MISILTMWKVHGKYTITLWVFVYKAWILLSKRFAVVAEIFRCVAIL